MRTVSVSELLKSGNYRIDAAILSPSKDLLATCAENKRFQHAGDSDIDGKIVMKTKRLGELDDCSGHVSKCGDKLMRHALYEACKRSSLQIHEVVGPADVWSAGPFGREGPKPAIPTMTYQSIYFP